MELLLNIDKSSLVLWVYLKLTFWLTAVSLAKQAANTGRFIGACPTLINAAYSVDCTQYDVHWLGNSTVFAAKSEQP